MSCFILVAGRTGAGKTTFAEAFTGLSVGYEEGSEHTHTVCVTYYKATPYNIPHT